VLHDDTLERTAPSADPALSCRQVSELTWNDIKGTDVGSWFGTQWGGQTLPKLETALRMLKEFRTAHCYAELKPTSTGLHATYDPRLPSASEAAVLAEGVAPEQLTWISKSLPLAVEMKRRMPSYQSLVIGEAQSVEQVWELARACVDSGLDGIDLNADSRFVTADLVEWLRERAKQVSVWVQAAPAKSDHALEWQAMADAGVHTFTSNLPPLIHEWYSSQQGGGESAGKAAHHPPSTSGKVPIAISSDNITATLEEMRLGSSSAPGNL